MPDKPPETTWVATTVVPTLRRGKRFLRRRLRQVRSRLRPQVGTLGEVTLALPPTVSLARHTPTSQIRRLDLIALKPPVAEQQIPEDYYEPLIGAEQYSVPTVLLVEAEEDLDHPLAAVTTHLVTAKLELLTAVQAFAGTERTALLDPQAGSKSQIAAILQLTSVHTPLAQR